MAVRVLVTDDLPAVREAIRTHLECIGCEVVAEAETAAQALPLFRTVKPEIVTLGVGLNYGGQQNPLDLIRLIKRESPETSVVMLGRADSSRDDVMFLSEGALQCVFEPFDAVGFQSLWRTLAAAHPELMASGFAAIVSIMNARKAS
jgi:DNA-binding response OmpR family regulator